MVPAMQSGPMGFRCPCACGQIVDGRLATRAARAMRVKELVERLRDLPDPSREVRDLLFAASRFWAALIRWAHDRPHTSKVGVPTPAYLQIWIERAERELEAAGAAVPDPRDADGAVTNSR